MSRILATEADAITLLGGMGCGTRSGPSADRMLAHTNALLESSLSHAALALA